MLNRAANAVALGVTQKTVNCLLDWCVKGDLPGFAESTVAYANIRVSTICQNALTCFGC